MNILIVASKFPPEYSGPGVRIPRLYKAIREDIEAGNIYVLCNGREQTKAQNYEYEGLFVRRRGIALRWLERLCASSSLLQRVCASFRHVLETLQADIALKFYNGKHINLLHVIGHSGATAAAMAWANAREIPIFMELVTAEALPEQKYHLLGRVRPAQPCKIMALTQKTQKAALNMGFSQEHIWCRPNPINTDIYKPEPHKKNLYRRAVSPFSEEDIVIATVAKIMPQKNQKLLIKALAHLPETYKALIAGPVVKEGPLLARDQAYLQEMRALIKAHALDTRVHIHLGYVDSSEYMKAADVYVMPAWNEGFGSPMLEAMACGVPVVANKDEPPFQEWIEDGRNGYLADIHSPEDWAQALLKAISIHSDARADMVKDIQEKAGQDSIYAQYIHIIKALTER